MTYPYIRRRPRYELTLDKEVTLEVGEITFTNASSGTHSFTQIFASAPTITAISVDSESNNIADVNIKAIQVMRDRYQTPVAYGHHCDVPNVIYASLGLLPESIFFYIKGSEDLEYPDNAHAIDLLNVEELVYGIKNIKKAIGNGEKISMKNWK